MNAKEAKAKSKTNAEQLAEQQARESEKKTTMERDAQFVKRAKYEKELSEKIEARIAAFVEQGQTELVITMSSESGFTRLSPLKMHGKDLFLKNFEFADEVRWVMGRLRKRGFTVELVDTVTRHDDSAAYFNSGGECGSETPYHTYDTVLKVSW